MCNSTIGNFTYKYTQAFAWNCICNGYFGMFFMISTIVVFFTVGTPMNCWSLWMLLRGNIKPSMVFTLNITVLELLYCFLCTMDIIIANNFSVQAYKFSMFLIGICWGVRPLLLICICFEHYLAVVHPVTFLRYKGFECRIAFAAAVWLIGASNGLRLSLTEEHSFPDHIFFLFFCIAVMVTSFCCVSVSLLLGELPLSAKSC